MQSEFISVFKCLKPIIKCTWAQMIFQKSSIIRKNARTFFRLLLDEHHYLSSRCNNRRQWVIHQLQPHGTQNEYFFLQSLTFNKHSQSSSTFPAKKSPKNSRDGVCGLLTATGLEKNEWAAFWLPVRHFDILEQKVLFKYKVHFCWLLFSHPSEEMTYLSSHRIARGKTAVACDCFLLKRP